MSANLRLYDESREGTNPPPPALSFAPIQDPDLSWRACGILWALCYWAWGKKPDSWPSNAQVARLTKCSVRTVQLGLAELIERNYLERRMVKSETGWRRVLTMTDRAPRLRIAPGARSCATPAQDLAPPPAQDLAPKDSSTPNREKKNLASSSSPEGGDTTTPGQKAQTEEPIDWRKLAAEGEPGNPFAEYARKKAARQERRENTTAPGSPARDPREPSIEGQSPSIQDFTSNPESRGANVNET